MYNLKKLRLEKGLNMKQVAVSLNLPYTTYVSYEKGDREPNSEILIKMADFYQTTIDFILDKPNSSRNPEFNLSNNIISLPKTKNIPLLGDIACGEPILATENISDYIKVDLSIKADFALRCKGDSMINARIFDGDIVYIRQQSDVDDGEIAAVLIGEEATLKKVYKFENKLVLRPCNPMYDDLIYSNDTLNGVKILGKAIMFTSLVRHGK